MGKIKLFAQNHVGSRAIFDFDISSERDLGNNQEKNQLRRFLAYSFNPGYDSSSILNLDIHFLI